ncbi:rRNA maturation RNase YbeY [Cesiribacter andamanensis]|uniref:Endoribonuclease YbeY n=1 Tax=Cesiribacter andamanensis AMV16 TaxID=1279009 RepID=M7N338_9BACT|nr:rRNA maturation RNase YbeY [Cesiribacter andamanensis]EMR03103.1 putative rRNA maturation factor [Cesiribacter andamanensis AMV16]
MPQINFFSEDIDFTLSNKLKTRSWIKKVCQEEGVSVRELNVIFCSDPYLRQLNKEYLQHDYFTDIVTFDNAEEEGVLEGDLFISIDRIQENSQDYAISTDQELRRVIIHGVLHLLGYGDKSEAEQTLMRQKEDACLSLYASLNQS